MATTRLYSQETSVVHPRRDLNDVFFETRDDVGKLLLRFTVGVLMLFHGIDKLLYGTGQVQDVLVSVGLPAYFSFGVILGEVIGPLMVILGYKARIGAALIAFDMLMAVLLVHSAQVLSLNEGGGWMLELNALYFIGAVAIAIMGSGRYGITHGHGPLD
jgi:putative oxidoreductase